MSGYRRCLCTVLGMGMVGAASWSPRSTFVQPLRPVSRPILSPSRLPGRQLVMESRKMAEVQNVRRRRESALKVSQLPMDTENRPAQSEAEEELDVTSLGGQTGLIIALCFICMVICSLDRVAMSVALLPMSYEFGLSETQKGAISSVFSLGYMTAMLPAGVLASAWSPKAVLAGGVAIWSVAQILSPDAAHFSLPLLLACRFAMGAAESVATPTVQTIVGQWVDIKWRSRVVALLTSGLNLGVLLAYLASPKVIALSSWETLFYVYGGLGLAWLLLWIPLGADKKDAGVTLRGLPAASPSRVLLPRTKPAAAAVEGEEEERDGWAKVAKKGVDYVVSVPWGEFVRSKELWAVTAAHMAHNYGLYVALAWLPSYFASEYHMDLSHSSALSVMPWVGAAIMTNVAGWLADGLINSETMDRTSVRKLFQSLALLIPAACMYSLAHGEHTPYEAQAIFTTSIAAGSLSSAGFGTATQDLAKKYVGITYGATSALSVVVGSIGTYATGLILDHNHSWDMVFSAASVVYVMGAVAFASMYQAKRIFD